MDLQVSVVPILGSSIVVAITWIFLPALSALLADDLVWEAKVFGVRQIHDDIPLLSIIVPAFDEEKRLPSMLYESHAFMRTEKGHELLLQLQNCANIIYTDPTPQHIEWIIVNDGSRDDTTGAAEAAVRDMKSNDFWSFVTLSSNSGKGAAVKTGMIHASGVFRLMVDADGATAFGPGLENLVDALQEEILSVKDHRQARMLAVFGSRAHLQNDVSTKRSLVRSMLMHAFHFFVGILVSSRVKDTQCGFKLFTKTAALRIFTSLHLHRWAFDTEVVLISEKVSVKLLEVDVPWQEVDGSKLNTSKLALAFHSFCMLRDMICVRLCYLMGLWKVTKNTNS